MTGNDAWLAPLRARFLARLGEELAAFRAASEGGETDAIIDRAHKLAGLAGTLGWPDVGEAALHLEERARSGAGYAPELAALIAAIEHARA